MDIGAAVTFLQMSRQFTQNINQASMQINSIVMGLAGASRVYNLIDQEPEFDEGYVTLVNAKYDEAGELVESEERTGIWAWKHPHKADGTITYKLLEGEKCADVLIAIKIDTGSEVDIGVMNRLSKACKPFNENEDY